MTENGYFSDIKSHLSADLSDKIEYFDVLDSTNDYLKKRVSELQSGIVIADCQTAGRGRHGRGFISPSGCGVYVSMLFRPDCAISDLTPLTCCASVAVSEAIENVCGVKPAIKWVNDLILGTKKVCGILTETVITPGKDGAAVIIGVGVNVNKPQSPFPEQLRDIAASIDAAAGVHTDRARLAAEIIKKLDAICENIPDSFKKYLKPYRKACISLQKNAVLVRGGKNEPVYVEYIDDDFALVVRHADGSLETVRSGEVSIRGLCGYC
ncbi:MAG: biotin--[Oscillospiraceae bacterium]|nr:biotin--[acetyl-CoA-carboxylase] ligase [Oscillospiraceae bacterium]